MNIVELFEEDCVSRIEAQRAKVHMNIQTDASSTLPSASFFLMGLSFGVIVARVACVSGLLRVN